MRRDDALLLDILIAAHKVQTFVGSASSQQFVEDELLQSAVMRQIEVIGEAARLVSEQTKDAHPEIPWLAVIGTRNRLIHEYFRIDLTILWDVVINDIPKLIVAVEPLVPSEDEV